MAETAPMTHYMGQKKRKPKKTAMSGYEQKKAVVRKPKARKY